LPKTGGEAKADSISIIGEKKPEDIPQPWKEKEKIPQSASNEKRGTWPEI